MFNLNLVDKQNENYTRVDAPKCITAFYSRRIGANNWIRTGNNEIYSKMKDSH